jgi:nucleotide-binding universal stress UspA family protein
MDAPVTVERVLVPVDGSDESTRAVEYAVAIADRYGADLRAVYVLGEQVVRAIETGAIDEDEVAAEAESYLADVETLADEAGVALSTATAYGFSTRRKAQHPGSVVLDCAEQVDADFVVVPREPQTGEPGEVLEKAAEYVLLYASQPVLSV